MESAYPIDEVDSFRDSQNEPPTVLMLVAHVSSESRHLSLEEERSLFLGITPIAELIEDKWNRYAKYFFYMNFFTYIFYVCIISIAVIRPPFLLGGNKEALWGFEAIVLFGACWTILQEIADLIRLRSYYWNERSTKVFYAMSWTSSLLFLCAAPLRLTDYFVAERIVVSLASLLSWTFLLYYARGFRKIGFYVVVIREMILEDLIRFLLIFIVFLGGFSVAFISLFRETNDEHFTAFPQTLFALFKMMLFDFSVLKLDDAVSSGLATALFVFYVVITGVLLLNLLIAMMNNTYSRIIAQSKAQWELERASLIMLVERRIPFSLQKYLRSGHTGRELGIDARSSNCSKLFIAIKERLTWENTVNRARYVHLRNISRRLYLAFKAARAMSGRKGSEFTITSDIDIRCFAIAREKTNATIPEIPIEETS